MSLKKLPDGRWIVVFYDSKGRQHQKGGFGRGRKAWEKADAWDKQWKADKSAGREVQPPRLDGAYIDDLAQHYLDHLKAIGRSQRFRDEIKDLFEKHTGPLLIQKPVDMLAYADMAPVVAYFENRKCHQHTINRYLRYLRTLFRHGIEYELTKVNPLAKWKAPKEPKQHLRLTVEKLGDIMEQAPDHLRWAVTVAFNLGCRPGETELFALKWEHVDWKESSVWIPGTKTTGSRRQVPITKEFRAQLKAREKAQKTEAEERRKKVKALKPTECEFICDYRGQPIKDLKTSWATACKNAKVSGVRLYDIRHLYATSMLARGADLAAVSALLGHKHISTTQSTYYHLLSNEKERAVGLLPKVGKSKKRDHQKVVPIMK